MKKIGIMHLFVFLLPWISLPLIGGKTIKKYALSSLVMSLYLILEFSYAEKKKWWWFPTNAKPNFINGFPLIFGPFLVGSIWIMKYSYGKFYLYLLLNIVVDSAFTYFGMNVFNKMGYATLVRLTKFQLSLVFFIKTFVLYWSQIFIEMVVNKNKVRKSLEKN
ncbi:hypothetical protein FZD47_02555 [Bacillus infantis]|uniref:Uncharacterized protein n=1 Tax=Bacillus infantis TaxID=324767 RepID=A0A5D4SSN7_9BACI|nr:hypothetical protein [Bacillus infantis]TYS66387.1 hypothetical protein FZD47_02555 [Bacillus infantis]